MPIQAPQWTEFLSCPICCHEFDGEQRGPISLGCGHTVCRGCLAKLQRNQCPYDQTTMRLDLDQLPVNGALLSLVNNSGGANDSSSHGFDGAGNNLFPLPPPSAVPQGDTIYYFSALQCIKELALLLKPSAGSGLNGSSSSILSRPMQRKLVTLINCQLVEEEGRARAVRAARSLGERTVTELILHHQNHHQLSANLWAAVRSRGCQFLGPAMQEEVLKLVLLALEDGSALSRKVLVMFVVQRLEPHFPQASKTSIGHVVQLLYRASCFKVSKREGDSSLMQLKEEFRTYEALRREHDAQIVQIATEAGLRIAPDQWSSLLYGDIAHKSHMQSIIDKLQTPQSFGQSVQELVIALQRTGDPGQLSSLRLPLELLAELDPSPDSDIPAWESCAAAMEAVKSVVCGLVQFVQLHSNRKITETHHTQNVKYKTSMCRDLTQKGGCPRGNDCTFAHTEDELEKYRNRNRKHIKTMPHSIPTSKSSTSQNKPSVNYNDNRNNSPKEAVHFNQKISLYKGVSDVKKQDIQQPHAPLQSPLTATPQLMSNHMPPQPTPIPPNQILSIPHPTHASDIVGSLLKNGERPSVLPLISKQLVVEEMMQTGLPPPAINPFEQQKFVPVPHSSTLPVMPASPGPSNVIRTALPPPAATPVYAAHIPEYAYGAFHTQGPIFAQPSAGHTGPPGLHPSAVGGPPTPVYSPQHPPPFIPEMYSAGAQTLLLNHGHVYNILSPAREFQAPPQVVPCAETRQTSVITKSVSSCLDAQDELVRDFHTRISSLDDDETNSVDGLASKSLMELKERKEQLLNQLENIVGKEAIDEVASQIANGEAVSTTSSNPFPESSSTYSIWTSGVDLSNISWSGKSPEKSWEPSTGYRSCAEQTNRGKGEDFIPFDPPFVSRFGPISRTNRPFMPSSNTIQVSARNTTESVTTPTVHRPVPAISPMPQVLYQHPGFTAYVSYPPSLEYMNTIGHGIIDPPHLHMSQLEPSGVRPSDPIQDFLQIGQEERQRQQFIAAKDGIDPNLHHKFEEMRLKEELNRVLQGIKEKKKEIEENKNEEHDVPDEDMTDFEKNWKFDFDEGEKDL